MNNEARAPTFGALRPCVSQECLAELEPAIVYVLPIANCQVLIAKCQVPSANRQVPSAKCRLSLCSRHVDCAARTQHSLRSQRNPCAEEQKHYQRVVAERRFD